MSATKLAVKSAPPTLPGFMRRDTEDWMPVRPPCTDIIVPIHNSLSCVQNCLYSLKSWTTVPYRLCLMDDSSDSVTASLLQLEARDNPQITLHRNSENLGFLSSANLGMKLGASPYLVLLNSDVIVTPGWLKRLIRCAESDSRIAAVNPFTNYASNIHLPMAPGANFYDMDWILSRKSPRDYPDVVTGVGFCMLLRRSALQEVGYFDEVFGRGYCEDSDLCMRLVAKGYRTVVADDVYVYHQGRGSFRDRDELYRENRKVFDVRWADEYRRQFRAFRRADSLGPARDLCCVPQRWDPVPSMRETYRRMRQSWRARMPLGVIKESIKGIRRLPNARRDLATPEGVAGFTRPERLRVTYVLHALTVAGGVLSVIQLVNELILLGVEARIATLREYPEIHDWRLLTRPMLFKNWRDLVKNLPETDVAVATHWSTASSVAELISSGRTGTGAYFVQDYEPWFFPESDPESRLKVRQTYQRIPHRIVKSEWLKSLLEKDGSSATKIRLGMDLTLFYPRDVPRPSHPVILAMARPGTPRRGFLNVIEAFRRVKEARLDVEIVLYGDYLSSHSIPFCYRDEGVITDQNRLAELYSEADVFLDASSFQGFGRTGLEAMACGTACVLTDVGGGTAYARHEGNCLLVSPDRQDLFAKSILRILEDSTLKQKLVQGGLFTVKDYCHKREARETLEYFLRISGWKKTAGEQLVQA